MTVELGVNTTNSGDQRKIDADLDLAHSLGFKWVRTSQEMHWGQDSLGTYALDVLDRYATACTARGLRLVQCCQGMPASLAKGGKAGHYGAKDQASAVKWGAWFGECAARVADTNGVTSCGNEWNGYGWGLNGTPNPNAADAAVLHAAAIAGRDRIAPDAIFSTCEMMPGDSPDPFTFLKDIVQRVPLMLTRPRVLIGWHPYLDPRYDALVDEVWNANARMLEVDRWLADIGHPRMKIMGGEWGIANGPVGNPRALSIMRIASYVAHQYLPSFDSMQADGVRFGPMVWYCLRDGQAGDGSWADYCGVVTKAGARKPVASVLQAYNEGTL